MITTANRRRSAAAFDARLAEVRAKLEQLTALVADQEARATARGKDWGYVGNLAHLAEMLGDAVDFIAPSEPPKFEPVSDAGRTLAALGSALGYPVAR